MKFNVGDRVVVVRDADGDDKDLGSMDLLGRFGEVTYGYEEDFECVVDFEDWGEGWGSPKMSCWGFGSTANLRRVVQKVNKH